MSSVDDEWPLIRYILDNPDCKTTYKGYVEDFADLYFNQDRMQPIYETYEELIHDSVISESSSYSFTSSSEFTTAVNYLISHVASRNSAATTYAGASN